jgi:catechol 2,3-dioxygenase-like lactoylglutathione lyase family enzyme
MMGIQLNHIIVPAHDRHASAEFLADVLGVPVAGEAGPFVQVAVDNGVTLDFMDANGFAEHHCAFLVGEAEFDAAYQRIKDRGIPYWADPFHQQPGQTNTMNGGRGLYFSDPAGHNMEILTIP